MPWSGYDGARISLRQGKAATAEARPLIESLHRGAAAHAGRHGSRVAADPHHQDRSIVQETLLRPTVGSGNDEAGLQPSRCPAPISPWSCTSMIFAARRSRCFQKPDARRNRSPRSPATRSRRYTGSWNAISRGRAVWPNRRSSTLRTHREQSLQTGCKPALPRSTRKEKLMQDQKLNGAPEEIRTPDPQIRSYESLRFRSFK